MKTVEYAACPLERQAIDKGRDNLLQDLYATCKNSYIVCSIPGCGHLSFFK